MWHGGRAMCGSGVCLWELDVSRVGLNVSLWELGASCLELDIMFD